jgi:hypothetical protein
MPSRSLNLLLRALPALAVVLVLAMVAGAASSSGDLASRSQSLKSQIQSDSRQIGGYQGRIDDLQQRLSGLEASLAAQRSLLIRLQTELAGDRDRLAGLRAELARGRRILAAQLVGQYEAPQPDLVSVVLSAHGFADLLERLDDLKRIERHNFTTVKRVRVARDAVQRETRRLTADVRRQQQVTAAVLVERDQVDEIKLGLLRRQQVVQADRARKAGQLRDLERRIAAAQARAAAAQSASVGAVGGASGSYTGGGFSSHGGDYGFFPAPGTNYSVGDEPAIAARLDALGKALRLHLIGLSGYRTPQHSVEVGGFANDPHTRGEASDTPGIEGVPEATLNRFGLTRPFPGAAEADHIQLLR